MPSPAKLCQLLSALLLINTIITSTNRFGHVEGAKVLGLFAHASESHFAVMRSVVLELTRREHDVTVYSSHRLNEHIDNLKEIIIEPEFPFWRKLEQHALGEKSNDLTKLAALAPAATHKALAAVGGAAVEHFLSHASVVQLLQQTDSEFDFDLIIVDLFYTEALLALGHAHNTPTIALVSANFEDYMQQVLRDTMSTACSINGHAKAPNVAATSLHHAVQEKLIAKHFGRHFKDTPTIAQLKSNLSVLLLNNHLPMVRPQPLLLNTIFAGGMHIRAPRELPWNVRRFLDESRIGVIYVHLGNEQQCGAIPPQRLQVLFDCLGARKEHVLWTCHDVEKLPNQPKNFMLQHMVAQTDILAHPHVNTFITNGDVLAVQEGIMRHVPMLSIPLFRHEEHNVHIAATLGITVQLDYNNVTTQSLNAALERLLDDPVYQHNIRQVARVYRDRPLGALETCMYWIEYVLRHKGGALFKTDVVFNLGEQSGWGYKLFHYLAYVLLVLIVLIVVAILVKLYVARHRDQSRKFI